MGGKSRERVWGDLVRGAKIRVDHARKEADEAIRQRDAAECRLWSHQMEGFGGPAQPSPTIGQALNGGFPFLEVQCRRCNTRTSIDLRYVRRKPETPVWTLEASLWCRHCRPFVRYRPQTVLIKLTRERETSSARWYPPADEDGHR